MQYIFTSAFRSGNAGIVATIAQLRIWRRRDVLPGAPTADQR
jgi:hypothetical protein